MAAKDLAKAKGPVLQVPVDLGGVAISYNIPGAPKRPQARRPDSGGHLRRHHHQLGHPVAIARAPGSPSLPNLTIVPVHRADTSGPGWDLDDYLIETSP